MSKEKQKGPMSMDMQIAMPDWPCKNCVKATRMEYKGKVYVQWNSMECDEYSIKPATIDEGKCPDFEKA